MNLRCDLHIHSCLSPCGDEEMTPGNIAGLASLCGLQLIALTDHNTCGNCRAVMAAGEAYGVTVVPGMELTTAEDIHVLCYFPDAETAERFAADIYARLPDMGNRADIFGRQVYRNEEDEEVGEEPRLLLNATDLAIEQVRELAHRCGGAAVPAHIDKHSDSVMAVFGYADPSMGYRTWEVTPGCDIAALEIAHPELKGSRYLKSSDAHWLEALDKAQSSIELPECSAQAFVAWLREETL